MLAMERDVLRVVDYDINAPVTYRFIRRLARVKGGGGRVRWRWRWGEERVEEEGERNGMVDCLSLLPPHTHTKQAASASMETHTMARYISESTLQDYQFVDVRPSLMAAACMYLALRMKKLGGWVSTCIEWASFRYISSAITDTRCYLPFSRLPLSNIMVATLWMRCFHLWKG